MLDIFLALDCCARSIENFEMYEFVYSVSFRVTFDKSILVFEYSPDKVACYPDVQRAAGTACEDVQVVLFHGETFLSEIAGTSPAMTLKLYSVAVQ